MQTRLPWAGWIGALTIWPLDLARSLLHRQAFAWRATVAADASTPITGAAHLAEATYASAAISLSWPFDLARALHSAGVQSCLLERSLLASAAFERHLGWLEQVILGPLARKV